MANQFRTYYGEYSLKHWIRMILSGEIALPPYQRHFVWNPEMVFKLLNNISKDLFVPPVILSSFSGDKKDKPTTYVLDGQQRLSAILITFLGLYPQKFDEFKSELANEENLNSETETFDDEERDKFLIWNFQEIQELYKEQGISTPDDLRIALEKSKKYIKINANIRNNLKDKEKLSEETLSEFLSLQIDDDFLTSHYLGFSYIRPLVSNPDMEKNMFSSIFRTINISSIKLLPEESREALYWLRPEIVEFLNPSQFKDIKVNKTKMDFARSLAFVAEAHNYLQNLDYNPETIKVALGYGRSRKFEEYFEKFAYSVIDNKRSNTFGKFNEIFTKYKEDIDRLYTVYKGLDFPLEFNGLVELDYYMFGLLYWVLFKKCSLDLSKKEELKRKLNEKIVLHKEEYRSTRLLGSIRRRLKDSIDLYEDFLEN